MPQFSNVLNILKLRNWKLIENWKLKIIKLIKNYAH